MKSQEIEEFLTHLAVNENVAASTQNQALHAIFSLQRGIKKRFRFESQCSSCKEI